MISGDGESSGQRHFDDAIFEPFGFSGKNILGQLVHLRVEKGLALLKISFQAFPSNPEVQDAVRALPNEVDQGIADHAFDRRRNLAAETERIRRFKRASAV